jgi:alpha-D-xyloside xylohydrolase
MTKNSFGLLTLLCLSLGLVSCQTRCPFAPARPAVERLQNGVQLTAGRQNVRVQFYAEDRVRVLKWVAGGTAQKASLVVIQTNLPDLNLRFEENPDSVTLASDAIVVQLSKSDGAIQYLNASNQIILKEQGGAIIAPVRIKHESKAFSVQQNFKLTPDEGIYGLGQHQSGYMNYRGRTVKLVQANTVPGFHPGLRAALGQLFQNHFCR